MWEETGLLISTLTRRIIYGQGYAMEYLMVQLLEYKKHYGVTRDLEDSQRSRIGRVGTKLPWTVMKDLSVIAHPVTISGWHRRFNLGICNRNQSGGFRAKQMEVLRKYIIRFARENPSWGYGKLQGALKCLGMRTCRSTVRNVLKREHLDPSPNRDNRFNWKGFIEANWPKIAAMDFFKAKVWTLRGYVDYFVHFVIDLETREVHVTNICPQCQWNEEVMMQVGRELTNYEDGFLKGKKYLVMDRDPLFTKRFRKMLRRSGVKSRRTSVRAPKMNNYAERFIRSIRQECLNKLVFLSEQSLRHAINEYVEFYNHERPHQGIENNLIKPPKELFENQGVIRCHKRLGGLLKYYYREAA